MLSREMKEETKMPEMVVSFCDVFGTRHRLSSALHEEMNDLVIIPEAHRHSECP